MRHLKKLLGLVMATVMVFAMTATSAFAAQGINDDSGTITINGTERGHTYSAYQILVLESYDTGAGAYSYKANSNWATWLATQTQYVSIDDQGYVTWVKNADVAAFAKAALAHAEDAPTPIEPTATKTADSTTVEFTNLNLGYYLVDTTVGTLCALDTTDADMTVNEKNEIPPVKKEVQEDSTGDWGDENTAEVGDTVNFRTTVTAQPGAQSYVLHDEMSEGLTFDPTSVKVKVAGQDLAAANYTINTTGLSDECDFEIVFEQIYLDTITTDTDIVVTYSAVLNENAVIYDEANTNRTKLEFGEGNRYETTWDDTKTYSFMFDIVKTDDDNILLDGAEFELYTAETGGEKIALVDEGNGVYRVATDEEKSADDFTSAVIVAKDGRATVKGLDDNTTYWLEETKAPDGYNKLNGRVEVEFGVKENISTSMTENTWQEGDGGIHVVNKAGSLLPTTGGMGTTIFYVAGGIIVVAAAGTLVYRKRMESNQ